MVVTSVLTDTKQINLSSPKTYRSSRESSPCVILYNSVPMNDMPSIQDSLIKTGIGFDQFLNRFPVFVQLIIDELNEQNA